MPSKPVPDLLPETIAAMVDHLRACMPYEGCGLIGPDGGFIPAPNVAAEPHAGFAVPPGMAEDLGAVAIVHSHPGGMRCPSTLDMQQQALGDLPWGIVRLDATTFDPPFWLTGQAVDPTGQGWRCGVTDCFNLVRWSLLQRGIVVADVPRGPDSSQWAPLNHLMMVAAHMGFGRVAEPAPGDICIVRLSTEEAAHLGIVEDGGTVWHHPGPMHGDFDAKSLPQRFALGWGLDQRKVTGFWRWTPVAAAQEAAAA